MVKAFTGVRWDIPYIGPIARKQDRRRRREFVERPCADAQSGSLKRSHDCFLQIPSNFTTTSVKISS